MRKSTIIILIIASVLTVLGAAIIVGGLSFDDSWLHPEINETTHETEENIERISVNVYTADVTLIATDEPTVKVVCRGETEKLKYSVDVTDGTLCVDVLDTRAWYDHIGIFFNERSISIFLPRDAYSKLTVNTDTGDVYIPDDLSFDIASIECDTGDIFWNTDTYGELKLKTDTGDIEVNNSKCKALEASSDTGDIKLNGTTADGDIRIQTSTGSVSLIDTLTDGDLNATTSTGGVKLERCDAVALFITTSTGDVKGSLLSDKIFICDTSTGKINVPSTETGGTCKIKTSTGDINITIE